MHRFVLIGSLAPTALGTRRRPCLYMKYRSSREDVLRTSRSRDRISLNPLALDSFSVVMKRSSSGAEPPSCDLVGVLPPTLKYFLEFRAYVNHYSVIKGYFTFKKLSSNRHITLYRVVKLRSLPNNIIIGLYKFVGLTSKLLI